MNQPSVPKTPSSARFRDKRTARERLNEAIAGAAKSLGFDAPAPAQASSDTSQKIYRVNSAPCPPAGAESRDPPSTIPAPAQGLSGGQRVAREIARRGWERDARAERSAERQRELDAKFFARHKAELEADARAVFGEAVVIPAETWRLCWRIVDDRSGRPAWHALRLLPTAYRGALWRAFAGRRWASSRVRRLVALTVALYTLRNKARRSSRWRYCVDNIPREALCLLLRETSTQHTPSVTALSGRHRANGDLLNGQIGYLRTLERVGILYRLQRRQCEENPSCNQYWMLDPHSAYTNALQRTFAAELARDAVFIERPLGARAPPLELH